MAVQKDLTIQQGKTFALALRWETEPIIRKAITGISFASGAPRLTVVGHGLVDRWRCAPYGIKGPRQLNAESNPPRADDYHAATVADADTIEFNDITPCDEQGNEWPAYVSGGFLQYNTPMDLMGYMARLAVKDKIGGTVLLSLTTENNGIVIDNAKKTITLTVEATATDDFTWTRGVYDLELISPAGVVTALITGRVSVTKEVTT